MGKFVQEYGGHIAAVLPAFLVVIGLIAIAALLLLLRRNHHKQSKTYWFVSLVSILFLLVSLMGLVAALGPMAPMFKSAQTLHAHLGKQTPDLVFKDVDNKSAHTLHQYEGRVILVNLWATWCPPCRQELPTLNRLQLAYGGRGLTVITLSDQPRDELKRFLMEHAPSTTNGYVTSFGWLAIRDFRPFTLLIDQHGVLRDFFFGAQSYELFENSIQKYLKRG